MPIYRLSFKKNPILIVKANDAEHAKEIAKMVHEFDGAETSEVIAVIEVKTLEQLLIA